MKSSWASRCCWLHGCPKNPSVVPRTAVPGQSRTATEASCRPVTSCRIVCAAWKRPSGPTPSRATVSRPHDLAHGEPVAAGGQIPAGRCVQRTQGLRGLLAADQDHRPVRGQPVAGRIRPDGVHPGVAQQPAQRVQCGGIGVRRRHQCRLAGEGHGGAEVPHRLGARPDGGQVSRAGRPVRLVGRADGGLHGRGLGAGRPAQQTPDDRGGQCGGPGHPRSGARSATPAAPTDLSDAPYAPASHGCSSSPSLTAGPHRRPIFPRRCPFGRTLGREPTIVAVRVSTGP